MSSPAESYNQAMSWPPGMALAITVGKLFTRRDTPPGPIKVAYVGLPVNVSPPGPSYMTAVSLPPPPVAVIASTVLTETLYWLELSVAWSGYNWAVSFRGSP